MKKILIISYNFAPRHTVGVIRPTKLAQALKEKGNHVDVVTVKPFGELDHSFDEVLGKLDSVIEIDRPIVKEGGASQPKGGAAAPQKKSVNTSGFKKMGFKSRLKHEVKEIMRITGSKAYTREFKKLVLADKEKYRSYDAVISSYGPVSCHLCGLVMKKYAPKVKWIADFRDPMVVNHTSFFTKGYRTRLQNRVCRKADSLVAVSNGYYQRIFGERYKHKASVIYNGFDRNDVDIEGAVPDNLFSFTYVGALYAGKRDITPLFKAVKELCDEGKMNMEDVHFKYAGNHLAVFESQAKKYGLEGRITDYGMLPRGKCLELQASTRHLVLSTWNEKGENGVFPGKFLEYIMMGKSIVSLVAGDEPNSEVSVVMKRAGLGITYEEATADADFAGLKKYVYRDYLLFKEGKLPELNINTEETERFDFANAAKQIEELI
ncbi:MAG: hypothetical protein IKU52_00890 [Clostridia bacterium]|nr:hypothetical protein [Clostridia bacterium]